ncbi:MAG TPA: nucleotidyltransferase family protein, partial [Acidobacteriota bacterium]|nr:nucleotidyltransferase family protein [Acidobacteriota bacterium]
MCSLLRQDLNWDYLLSTAQSHGILFLLERRLEKYCAGLVPPGEPDRLRSLLEQNARRNLLLTAELLSLLKLLENAHITAIPYKGPALAAYLYGDFALRRIDDLDILVRKSDVWKTHEILRSAGFVPSVTVSQEQLSVLFKSECDLSFTHRQTKLVVEVHWALAPPFYGFQLRTDDLWKRLECVDLSGTEVPALSREDLLLAVCVHGTKHLWERLEWICGVAELARSESGLDWARTWSEASSLHVQRILLLGMALAYDLLRAELPDEILKKLKMDKAVTSLVRSVRDALFSNKAACLFQQTLFR